MSAVATYEALLSGATWNGSNVTGQPTFLTYSFDTAAGADLAGLFSPQFLASFQAFTDAEETIARQALQDWVSTSGLTLFEVPAGQGDIRFGKYDFSLGGDDTDDLAGFAYLPAVETYPDGAFQLSISGRVFVDMAYADYTTISHEIGHALGLKHPFEGEPTLISTYDDLQHTVMTYNTKGFAAVGLGTLDVQAIRFLYGGPTTDGAQVASWSWDSAHAILTQRGGAVADRIAGVATGDRISAGGGDDYVFSRGGADILNGELGNDTLSGGDGADTLQGAGGDDVLDGDSGADLIQGGDGADELWAFGGSNTLSGDAGDDVLYGGDGFDRLDGGTGDDALVLTGGSATVSGGEGHDQLWLVPTPPSAVNLSYASFAAGGTTYSSIESFGMIGGAGGDTLQGGALPDLLYGDHGADSLVGAAGDDELSGEWGADTVLAGSGSDTVTDIDGRNFLRGEEGDDSLSGGVDFDDINGNMGRDTAAGGLGDDWVVGGKDADVLYGEAGDDIVYGNMGADTCDGGEGADIVRGGQNDDQVLGGAGNDFVSGDRGDDTVTGGAGADLFHTFGEAGADRVTDFHLAEGDRVMLDPGTTYAVAQVGADTVITMDGGGRMVLAGVQMSTLTGDWIFGA